MNFLRQGFEKLEHYRQTDRQTDAAENITTPHLRDSYICMCIKIPLVKYIGMQNRLSPEETTTVAEIRVKLLNVENC